MCLTDNRRGTRLIWITWRLTRQTHYRRMPISPNFNQGVEECSQGRFRLLTVRIIKLVLLRRFCLIAVAYYPPRSCDRRKLEAQARQRRTPFWCQRNTAMDKILIAPKTKNAGKVINVKLRII